jgi:photosystem II stability/assembly factor-like uncharacterized protein
MKTFRYIPALALLFLMVSTTSAQNPFWVLTDSLPTGHVTTIASIGNYLFAGDGGRLYRSSSLSAGWQKIADSVTFISKRAGILLAASSRVKISTDSGNTWQDRSVGLTNLEARAVAVNSTGYLFVGARGALYRSTNNGNSWSDVSSGIVASGDVVLALLIDSQDRIYAGVGSSVFRSTDNGQSWTRIWQAPPNVLYHVWAIAITPAGHIFICIGSNDGGIYRSTDDGVSWESKISGLTSRTVQCIAQHPNGTIYVGTAGSDSRSGVFESYNNGDSWSSRSTGLIHFDISALAVSPSGFLYAGSWWGHIYRSSSPITAIEENRSSYSPSEYSLHQNYPNPFNPATTISFSLPLRSFVSLKVFDALGRQVSILVSEELPAGKYSRQWNAAGIPSGVYFYRLQAGSFVETKKLILLK